MQPHADRMSLRLKMRSGMLAREIDAPKAAADCEDREPEELFAPLDAGEIEDLGDEKLESRQQPETY